MVSYPQYEEPVLAEHYNLVAFDARGHGMTAGDLDEGCEYSWKDVAHDIHDALVSPISRGLRTVSDEAEIAQYYSSPLHRCWLIDDSSGLLRYPVPRNCSDELIHRSESEYRDTSFSTSI